MTLPVLVVLAVPRSWTLPPGRRPRDVGAAVEQGGEFAAHVSDGASQDGATFHGPEFDGVDVPSHGGPAVAVE